MYHGKEDAKPEDEAINPDLIKKAAGSVRFKLGIFSRKTTDTVAEKKYHVKTSAEYIDEWDQAIKSLCKLVATCSSLKVLKLNRNPIQNEGAARIAAALQQPACNVHELYMSEMGIGDEGAKQLASTIKGDQNLVVLALDGTAK